MNRQKIPMRKCVGCNEMKPKTELIRIVISEFGKVSVDRTGKASGRGAYICDNEECFRKAIKIKGIERSLKVRLSEEIVLEIEKEFLND